MGISSPGTGGLRLQAAATGAGRVRKLALLGFGAPMLVGAPLLEAAAANDPVAVDMMTIWGHDFGAQIGGQRVSRSVVKLGKTFARHY